MPQMTAATPFTMPTGLALQTPATTNANFVSGMAEALAAIVKKRQSTKRGGALRDVLAEIQALPEPGWVNPDEGKEPGFTQLPGSDVTRGAVPAGAMDKDALASALAAIPEDRSLDIDYTGELTPGRSQQEQMLAMAMQPGGGLEGYDPAGGPVVPITPFRPEDAVLVDKTQRRGKEALMHAMVNDPRLAKLEMADVGPASQMVMNQMIAADEWVDISPDDPEFKGTVAAGTRLQRNTQTGEVKEVVGAAPTAPETWSTPVGIEGLAERFPGIYEAWKTDPEKKDKVWQISSHGQIRDTDTKALVNIEAERAGIGAYTRGRVESLDKQYNQIVDLATSGRANLEITEMLPNVYDEGGLATATNAIRRAAHAIGYKLSDTAFDNMVNQESYNRGLAELLKNMLATQKGPQTDSDAARLKAALPLITNSRKGRELGIYMMEAMAHRRISQKAFYDDWARAHPWERPNEDGFRGYEGAEQAWDNYTRLNPMAIGLKSGKHDNVLTYQDFKGQYLRDGYERQLGDDTKEFVPGVYNEHGETTGLTDIDRQLMTTKDYTVEQMVDHRWRELAKKYRDKASGRDV